MCLCPLKKISKYHIDTFVSEKGKEPWRISFIYGEANRSLRYHTWDIMKQMRSDSNLPWVCMGDFNEILRRKEQLGPNNREEYLMEGFRNAVDVCQLCDIGSDAPSVQPVLKAWLLRNLHRLWNTVHPMHRCLA